MSAVLANLACHVLTRLPQGRAGGGAGDATGEGDALTEAMITAARRAELE
jgi:hypothetical protein